ncbi:beta strand repeat-containing protein [Flavobacterium tegetincola]|uniref:beta strand repeat-containing protein n=1 Tax=Flavobacterium tegetincola TaxID=150172 RepID=UPI000427B844|nr:YDG domain-containing protein [Flavobacterium tegetincola]
MSKTTQSILAECRNNFKTIAVFCCLLFMTGGAFGQVTIENQNFTDGSLPNGWTQNNITFTTSAGGYANFTTTSSILTSPTYNLTGYTNVKLSLSVAKFGSGSDGPVTIQISDNGGSTWTAQTFNSATPTGSNYIDTEEEPITISGPSIKIRITRTASSSQKRFRNYLLVGTPPPAAAPVVTAATVNTTVGTNPNYQMTATNSPTSYTLTSGTLPAGLSLNTSSGVISGITTTAGNSSVYVTATNASGTSPEATIDFVVAKSNQTITFTSLVNKQYGDADFNLSATASSGLNVSYNSSNTNVATIIDNTVTIIGIGTTDITASQAGNANYNDAINVVRTLTVSQRNLTISGLTGDNKAYNASNVATVSGTPLINNVLEADIANVTLSGIPTFTFANATIGVDKSITANGYSLAGSAAGNYNLTQPTGLTATISAKTITVTGVVAQNKVYDANTIATVFGGTLVGVEAADNANLSISTTGVFASANAGTGIGVTVTLTGSAATNYTLTQPGLTADITKATQTVTFNSLPALNTGSAPINLNTFASTTSGLALTYMSSNSNVLTISGNTLTVVGLGTAIITASQEGNTNYNVAINTTQTVMVSLIPMIFYSHNFNDSPSESPYVTSPLTTIPTGILNSNITSSQWVSSTSNFTSFLGNSGTALVIQPSNGDVSSMTLNISIATGYKLDLTDYSFWARRTSNGPTVSSITVNSIAISNAISISTSNSGEVVSTPAFLNTVENLTGNFSIVINLTAPSSSSQNLRLDDFKLTGYITPLVTATTWIITSPATTPAWTNGTPTALTDAIIAEDYNETAAITAKNLTINTGKVLTIQPANTLTVAGDLTNEGSIIFQSDATGTASFAAYTGVAIAGSGTSTVERYIPAGKRAFRFLTPSVTTTTNIKANWQNDKIYTAGIGTAITGSTSGANGFDTTVSGNPSMYTYNNQVASGTGWTPIPNTDATTLLAGTGYRILIRGDRTPTLLTSASQENMNVATTLSATGMLVTGTVILNASSTPAINNTSNTTTDSFSLVGNPYASPIDWNAVGKSELVTSYYGFEPNFGSGLVRGKYVVYDASTGLNNEITSNIGRYIQSGQAFMVKNSVAGTAGTLTFNESNKASTQANVFRTANVENATISPNAVLRLSVYDPNELALASYPIDGTVAVFGEVFTNSLGYGDVIKLMSTGENLGLSRDSKTLAIEALAPVQNNDELLIKTTQFQANKSYTFKLNATGFASGVSATLVDQYLNTQSTISMGENTFAPFNTTTDVNSYDANRFKIVFSTTALGNGSFDRETMVVYPNPVTNNIFNISVPNYVKGPIKVSIYNMAGQNVYHTTKEALPVLTIRPDAVLSQGIYIVQITNDGTTTNSKITIQ